MSIPQNEKYWKHIEENFPEQLDIIKMLWDEKEQLRARITEIESELLKYTPPKEKE